MNSMYRYEDNLQSSRLYTRFLTPDDSKVWAEFFKDKEAVEFFPLYEFSDEQRAAEWIERLMTRYATQRYGLQAIFKKDSHEFLGQCGLLAQEVDGVAELEVGYHFLKKYWGNGYAPEAAKLFIEYAFQHDLAPSIISIIDRKNLKSQRVADKNGLVREKATVWSGLEVYLYRIKKENWKPG